MGKEIKEIKEEILEALEVVSRPCPKCESRDTYTTNGFWNCRCNNCGEHFD